MKYLHLLIINEWLKHKKITKTVIFKYGMYKKEKKHRWIYGKRKKFVTALYTDYGKLRIKKMRIAYKKKDGIFVDALA
jgi:hypothetical protein